MQDATAGLDESTGSHVRRGSFPRCNQCFCGPVRRCNRKNCVLPRKSSRDVLRTPLCIRSGKLTEAIETLRISNHFLQYCSCGSAQVAIETIYVAIQTLVYTLLLYSMIGFQWTAGKFLWFYYYILMCYIYFTMYGMMVVALTPGHQIAAIVMSFFVSFWNLFSGFLLPRPVRPSRAFIDNFLSSRA